MKIYDVYDRESSDDGSSYDNKIYNDSCGSNNIGGSDSDFYCNDNIESDCDVMTNGGGGGVVIMTDSCGNEVVIIMLMVKMEESYDDIMIMMIILNCVRCFSFRQQVQVQ